MFYGTDIQKLYDRIDKLEDKVRQLNTDMLSNKRNLYCDLSTRTTEIYERTANALTIERDGKELRVKEVIEALLDYYELDVEEVSRHLNLIERENDAK